MTSVTTAELRPATDADRDAIAAIWAAGWQDGHLGNVPEELVAHRTLDDLRALVPVRVPITTVATLGDVIVGFVTVHDDEVEQVYVDTAARGTGVAALLLGHAESVVARDFDQAWLAVVAGNTRARRFYERSGWSDGGGFDTLAPLPDGTTIPVPARRYVKAVRS